jgi:hypothetical protein
MTRSAPRMSFNPAYPPAPVPLKLAHSTTMIN